MLKRFSMLLSILFFFTLISCSDSSENESNDDNKDPVYKVYLYNFSNINEMNQNVGAGYRIYKTLIGSPTQGSNDKAIYNTSVNTAEDLVKIDISDKVKYFGNDQMYIRCWLIDDNDGNYYTAFYSIPISSFRQEWDHKYIYANIYNKYVKPGRALDYSEWKSK